MHTKPKALRFSTRVRYEEDDDDLILLPGVEDMCCGPKLEKADGEADK